MAIGAPQIKLMTLRDLPELMRIERLVFNPPASASVMRDSLRAAHIQAWGLVQEETAELLGFGVLSVVLDEAELLTLAIAPTFQGQGYGKQLTQFLIEKALLAKAEMLYLEVRVSHGVARSLYQKLGFTELGIRKDYYPISGSQQREDAVLLSLRLSEAARISQ